MVSFSDDEYTAIMRAAWPIPQQERDDFLTALAAELERHPVVGPGLVHRCAAALQKTFVVAAHSETSHTAERHKGAPGGRMTAIRPESRGFHRTGCQFPWYPWASKPT